MGVIVEGQTKENRTEVTRARGADGSVIAFGTGDWNILIRRLHLNLKEIDAGVGHPHCLWTGCPSLCEEGAAQMDVMTDWRPLA